MQNFLALVPLALLLGEVTEDLALRFGDVIGGLLNATFGNVVRTFTSLALSELASAGLCSPRRMLGILLPPSSETASCGPAGCANM